MIVVSMLLAAIAVVLLVVGIWFTSGLGLIYASIVTALLGVVAWVAGVRQLRRADRPDPTATAGSDTSDGPAASPASGASAPGVATGPAEAPEDDARLVRAADAADCEPVETDDLTAEAVRAGGTVLVVPGRRRYHVRDCGHLHERAAEERDVAAALGEGYTPCGTCAPDRALVTLGATYGQESPEGGDDSGGVTHEAEGPGGAERSDPTPPDVAVEPGSEAWARRTGPAEPIVVGVGGAFHRVECPQAGAGDAEPMTKATARRRELAACGTCRP